MSNLPNHCRYIQFTLTCIHNSKQEIRKYNYMARDKQLVAQESGFKPCLRNLGEGISCWARGRIARTTGANLLQVACHMLATQIEAVRQHTRIMAAWVRNQMIGRWVDQHITQNRRRNLRQRLAGPL